MKINAISNTSFNRAFSTQERKTLDKIQEEARKELALEETSAIIFDFNVPSQTEYNYGIGTLNSSYAPQFIKFLKDISSISKIQTSPQGEFQYSTTDNRVYYTTSPYSGTTFTIGAHTIALEKLCSEKYGSLLDENYVKSLDKNYKGSKEEREYKTDYDYVLGLNHDGVLFQALHKAYNNFQKSNNNGLIKEFEEYKSNLSDDIRKNLEYDNKQLNEPLDFLEFCQFIAFKQHMETKENLNSQGIKYFGDCLICFSPQEIASHPNCFKEGLYTGVEDPNCPETNNIQAWWTPSLNYDNLGKFNEQGEIIELGETGKLLYNKFKNFLTLYDGVRLDAFWQYVTPFEYDKDLKGQYRGDLGNKILKIIERASYDTKGYFSPDDFVLELVGYGTQTAKDMTKNIYPHIYSTAFAEYDENPTDLKQNKCYRDGKFLIGMANHDNDTMVNMSRDENKRNTHWPILHRALKNGVHYLGYDNSKYHTQSQKDRTEQDFRTAKAAEIYTTTKQYYTLTDLFGMSEKINNTGKVEDSNWKVRIPNDYERFYYSQISKGYGINFPKSYEIALRAKNSQNQYLINKLHQASEILAQDGPMTQAEANKAGKLELIY